MVTKIGRTKAAIRNRAYILRLKLGDLENRQSKGRKMFDLGPDLPDDILVEMVRIPTRIRNAMNFAGFKIIGEIRETTDATLASIPNLGAGSVKWLRERLQATRPVGRGMKAKGDA